MTRPVYSTTFWRALAALLCGSVAAGAAWAVALTTVAGVSGLEASPSAIYQTAVLALGVFEIYAIGLIVIGGPAWGLLHLWRRRSPTDALFVGALLSFIPAGLMFANMGAAGLGYIAFATVLGAVVGWVIWRVAYRRVA